MNGQVLAAHLRKRHLAGDARAGRWARAKARRAHYDYVRSHVTWLVAGVVVVCSPAALAAAFVPSEFLRGMVIGGSIVAAVGLVSFHVVQVTGTAPIMMGDLAEQWTAGELRRLQRSGWHLANDLRLEGRNVDHLLIGPGGIFVIETKWSSIPWTVNRQRRRLSDAVQQVHKVSRSLGLWKPIRDVGTTVRPVVMLWGGGLGRHTEVGAVDGSQRVAIVAGPRADEWRNGLRNDVLSPQQVAEVWSAVDELIAIRAKHDLIKHPELPSVQQVALRCILATCSAFVAFVSLALLLGWSGSLLWTGIGATGASVFAGILVRAGPVPHLGWGWFFGTAAFLTVGGATYLALIV